MPDKRPIPPPVLDAGRTIFSSDDGVRAWLARPAAWANGLTPWNLIDAGRQAEVLDALKGIGYGHVL